MEIETLHQIARHNNISVFRKILVEEGVTISEQGNMVDHAIILGHIASVYNLTADEMLSRSRSAIIVKARMVFIYIMSEHYNKSDGMISHMLPIKRITVFYHRHKAYGYISYSKGFRKEIEGFSYLKP